MNTAVTHRQKYARLALFSCFAIVLAAAVWRVGFAGTTPFVDQAKVQAAQRILDWVGVFNDSNCVLLAVRDCAARTLSGAHDLQLADSLLRAILHLIVVTPKNYSVETAKLSLRSIQADETNCIQDFAGGYSEVNHITLTSGITNTTLCNW